MCNMKCRDVEKRLSDYLDQMLHHEEKELVAGHIQSCPGCASRFEELKKTVKLTRRIGEVEPPAWLKQRVMSRVRKEVGAGRRILSRLFYPLYIKVPLEVIATISIAVTAFYLFRTAQPDLELQVNEPVAVMEAEEEVKRKRVGAEAPVTGREVPSGKDDVDTLQEKAAPAPAEPRRKSRTLSGARPGAALQERVLGTVKEERAPDTLGVDYTVFVNNASSAVEQADRLLAALNGRIIRRYTYKTGEMIIVKLPLERFSEFYSRLSSIGHVKEQESERAGEGLPAHISINLLFIPNHD